MGAAMEIPTTVVLTPARYVTVAHYAIMSGKSEGALRKYMERGIWLEGREYKRDKLGCVWVDTKGVERWVEATA